MTLPVALHGHDIIGQAKTGTGKTLGFGIPLLQRVVAAGEERRPDPAAVQAGKPQALVVVPTRELGVQVTEDLEEGRRPSRDDPGAVDLRRPRVRAAGRGAASKGVEVVVGTPGRLLDLAQQGHLDLGHVRSLVLDEADEMLDLGFLPDVERIVRLIPAGRQTMLFSATMPGAIITLARPYMHHPTHIRAVDPDDDGQTVKAVEQHVFRAHAMDKVEMLARILQSEGRGLTMVFCRTKRTAAKVADDLAERGFAAAAVHGDLGQGAREQALRAFRNGKVDVLVATDVAARGIDVEDVTHVINYQCPEDEKTYLHRIGRTGRAGAKGIAVTFVDWDDMPRWGLIDKALDLGFAEPEETYSTSEHLYRTSTSRGTHGRAAARAAHPGRAGRRGGRGPRRDRPGRRARRAERGGSDGAKRGDRDRGDRRCAAASGPTGRSGPSGRRARTASAPAPAAASRRRPPPRPRRRPATPRPRPATALRAGVAAAAAAAARGGSTESGGAGTAEQG